MASLNPLGTPFLELLSVDSTNNYAMGLVRAAMAHHGTAVFAREQTRGKGQRDRHWMSAPRLNIAMSVIIEPDEMDPSALFLLSMAIAVGSLQFIQKYIPSDCSIKWPNDLYWRDRKAGGILIENVWQGTNWKYAVAGIGININQVDFGMLGQKAVSLKQITGREFDPVVLAKELCTFLEQAYRDALHNPASIISRYRSALYKLNQPVTLKKDSRVFVAIIKDVTPMGQLVVEHGTEEKFDVGEVEWMV